MKSKEPKTLRNLIIFALIVLSCGWFGRLVDTQVGTDENGSFGQLIWIVSPLLSMVVLRGWMGDGWKDFGFHPRFKGNLLMYAFNIIFFPAITTVVLGISLVMGWTEMSQTSSSYIAAVAIALLPSFIKNIFEEFAWRGYLAPKLFSLGYHRLLVHAVVGVIWGAWHLPYLFLFVETTESMLTYIPRILIGVIAMAIVYGEVLLITRSVWSAVVMHTVGNAFVDTLILQKFILIHKEFSYVAMPSPEGMLTIALTGLIGLWLYKRRGTESGAPTRPRFPA